MEKIYYSYDLFKEDSRILLNKCKSFEPDTIVAIARGGLTLSHVMAQALDIRNLFTLNSIRYNGEKKLETFNIFNIPNLHLAKRVLIVDDIVDTGETMYEIIKILKKEFPHIHFKIATLYYKTSSIVKPDFCVREADDWIDFFWEIDLK